MGKKIIKSKPIKDIVKSKEIIIRVERNNIFLYI